jgi:hypothetical protein
VCRIFRLVIEVSRVKKIIKIVMYVMFRPLRLLNKRKKERDIYQMHVNLQRTHLKMYAWEHQPGAHLSGACMGTSARCIFTRYMYGNIYQVHIYQVHVWEHLPGIHLPDACMGTSIRCMYVTSTRYISTRCTYGNNY